MSEAEGAHFLARAAIEKRIAHLVRDDRKSVAHREAQVTGVEVGHSQVLDQSLIAQCAKLLQRIDPAWMLKHPPVKLHEVDAVRSEPLERPRNRGAHDFTGHR